MTTLVYTPAYMCAMLVWVPLLPPPPPPLPVCSQILVAILLRYKRRTVELNCVIYFDRKVKIIKIVLQPKFANVTKVYVCPEVRKYICVSYF